LTDALDATVVLGLTTNLRFLRWLIREPAVRQGQVRTDTLERIWPPDDWAERVRIPDGAWRAAAMALASDQGPWSGGWRLNAPPSMRLQAGGAETRTVALTASRADSPTSVRVGDVVHIDLAGRSVPFTLAVPPDVDRAARTAARSHGTGPVELVAPMPGSVIAIHATSGDALSAGDPVVTIEAMKMEHAVTAPIDGHLTELAVTLGDQVTRGQALAAIEP
jgi:acetyl-CoA/propionyl-CoA carboxylase biotin carboxyl carrier protein